MLASHGPLAAPASPPAPPTCNSPGWTLKARLSFECRLFNKKITEKRKIHTEEGWEDGVVVQTAADIEPVLDSDCGVLGAVAAGESRARRPPVQVGFVAFNGELVFQPALLCGSIVCFPKKSVRKISNWWPTFLRAIFRSELKSRLTQRLRISKNYCATNFGPPEVELRFFPWIILFNYWTGWPAWGLCPIMWMHRGMRSRYKVRGPQVNFTYTEWLKISLQQKINRMRALIGCDWTSVGTEPNQPFNDKTNCDQK